MFMKINSLNSIQQNSQDKGESSLCLRTAGVSNSIKPDKESLREKESQYNSTKLSVADFLNNTSITSIAFCQSS